MAKTILVTGGVGFIGSHVVESLLKRNDKVIIFDDFSKDYAESNAVRFEKSEGIQIVKGNIEHSQDLAQIPQANKINVVLHLAAKVGVRESIEKPGLFSRVNVGGLVNVLEFMKDHHIGQIVFGSSSSVYGERESGPFGESDRTDEQISPYGATKKSGELMCGVYARLYRIKTTCLRFFTVYGPRNRRDMACFKFVDSIYGGNKITLFGDGGSGRDYTYIGDIVEGIIGAIDKPFEFEVINLGYGSPVTLAKLVKMMESIIGKQALIKKESVQPGDVSLTYAARNKAKKLLGWEPRVGIENGLEKLFEWYIGEFGNA